MQRWRPLIVLLLTAFVAVLAFAACSGGDDTTSSSTIPTDNLEARLASTLLTENDAPAGFQRAALSYSTNQDLARSDIDSQAKLAKLDGWGRLLGVDTSFLPLDDLPADVPVRGGIQNSVSVYLNAQGAGQSLQEDIQKARQADWKQSYADLKDVAVVELPRSVGDESVWFRVTGLDSNGALATDDQVVFRAGSARAFLRVLSIFPAGSPTDVFADRVAQWAETVVQRTQQTFPGGSSGS